MVEKVVKKVMPVLLIAAILTSSIINIFASDLVVNNQSKHEDVLYNESIIEDKIIDEELETEEVMLNEELYEIIDDPSTGIDELKEAILKPIKYSDGMSKKYEISNLATYTVALRTKYPEMSELALGKTILLSLGDSEEFLEKLPNEKIIEATGYLSVVKTESFYKQKSNGERIELSEDEYYLEIANVSACQLTNEAVEVIDDVSTGITTLSSPNYDQTETMDSYIKLTSTAYKTNPSYAQSGRNYFTIRGEVVWTKNPLIEGKDILAIASSGNIDNNYSAYAFADWGPDRILDGMADYTFNYAYIDQNGGEGTQPLGGVMKIYNPSIYGIALDVNVSYYSNNMGETLQNAYIYYGISTQDDVTCQVGYAHQTMGLGEPSVSIDGSGSLSFSVGLASTMNEYYGRAFMLYHESYSVLLSVPANNATLEYNSAPPTFSWNVQSGNPEKFELEIDYLNNGWYQSINVNGGNYYQLSSNDWNTIKDDAPFFGSGTKRI